MKNTTVIANPSFYYVVITTIVYALLCHIFFEMDNTYGEGVNFVVYDDDYDKTMMYSQQQLETPCKSPCPPNAEMCVQISA